MKLLSSLIRKEDFNSLRHEVLFRNDTSGTQINSVAINRLCEVQEDGIIISTPLNSCKKNHNLTVYLFSHLSEKKLTLPPPKKMKGFIEVTGKIEKEEIEDEILYVTIRFNQFDEYRWKKIYQQYVKIQDDINNLIEQKEAS
jgi:hypothetical protein